MSLLAVLDKFDHSRCEHARYPVLGTIAGVEKVVMGVALITSSLVIAILTLLPSIINKKSREVFFASFSYLTRGLKSLGWGCVIAIPLVGSFSHYRDQTPRDAAGKINYLQVTKNFEEGFYYDSTIPFIGICAAAYRILWGISQLISSLVLSILLAIPAFFDKNSEAHRGAQYYFNFHLKNAAHGLGNVLQGIFSAIPLTSALRGSLPAATPLEFFRKTQEGLSVFSPVPVLGSLSALGKVIMGVIQVVVAVVTAIFALIPALFHPGAEEVLRSSGAHILAGFKGFFEGVVEIIPVLGMVAVATRKIAKEKKELTCENLALECEGQLSLWAPYPVFGTFCGLGKIILGTIQATMALVLTLLSALPALVSTTCAPCFHRSVSHVVNGGANILSGLFEALPFIGPLFFAVRTTKIDGLGKNQSAQYHFSWITYWGVNTEPVLYLPAAQPPATGITPAPLAPPRHSSFDASGYHPKTVPLIFTSPARPPPPYAPYEEAEA